MSAAAYMYMHDVINNIMQLYWAYCRHIAPYHNVTLRRPAKTKLIIHLKQVPS